MLSNLLLLLLLFMTSSQAFDGSHAIWARILKAHTTAQGVQYAEIKKHPDVLDSYLKDLSTLDEQGYLHLTQDEKLAFWINAFNAFAVKRVVDHYPVASIDKTGGFFTKPFQEKFFTLLGKKQSLDGIRNDILRYEFKKPRVLFALCEATRSGPRLQSEPFLGSRLQTQIDHAEKEFMGNPTRASFDSKRLHFKISKYLKRYNKDFEEDYMLLKSYLAQVMAKSPEEKKLMEDPRTVTEFFEWDASLNEAPFF